MDLSLYRVGERYASLPMCQRPSQCTILPANKWCPWRELLRRLSPWPHLRHLCISIASDAPLPRRRTGVDREVMTVFGVGRKRTHKILPVHVIVQGKEIYHCSRRTHNTQHTSSTDRLFFHSSKVLFLWLHWVVNIK